MGVQIVAPCGPRSRTTAPAGQPPSGSRRPSTGAASVVSTAGSCSPGCLSVLAQCYSYTPRGWQPCFHCLGEWPTAPQGAEGAQGQACGLGSPETFVPGPSSSLRPCCPVPRGPQPPAPSAPPGCPPGCTPQGHLGLSSPGMGAFPPWVWAPPKPAQPGGTRWAAGSQARCAGRAMLRAGLRSHLSTLPGEAVLGRDPSPAATRGRNGHASTSQAPSQPRELCRALRPSLLCTSGSPIPNVTSHPWLTDPPLPSGPRPSFCRGASWAGPHVSPATGTPGLHVHVAV